eukprot:1762535-Amphidinium_carterae.2
MLGTPVVIAEFKANGALKRNGQPANESNGLPSHLLAGSTLTIGLKDLHRLPGIHTLIDRLCRSCIH